MLVCIAVVVFVYIRQYAKSPVVSDSKAKEQKLHTFYISGILVFIIIELVTGICMGSDNHSDILSYVSFAATLSSLIMSVVAIIFTIVSSGRGEGQYRKIDNASDKVIDALSKFSDKTSDIEDSVTRFKEVASDITGKMDELRTEMGSIHSEVRDIKKLQAENLDNANGLHAEVKGATPPEQNVESRFVYQGSFSGNIAIYASVLAKETGKTFAIKQIITTPDDILYMFGYLVAAISAGIIEGQVSPDSCIITNHLPNLKEHVVRAIDGYINKQTDEVLKNQLQTNKRQVEELFGLTKE